jgi:hypothetical protein
VLAEPLGTTVGQSLAFNKAVGALGRYSLVTVTEHWLTVHRLVQTVVRTSLIPADQQQWSGAAARLITAAFPRASQEVSTWPDCAALLPHALTVINHAQAMGIEAKTAALLCNEASLYLQSRGQYHQALSLCEQALVGYRQVMDDDHPYTLTVMSNLAAAPWALGDLDGARDLHEQALPGFRRVLGDDHPYTLNSMKNLATVRRKLEDGGMDNRAISS